MSWIPIETPETLEEIKAQSINRNVIIFKHSTRCFISKMVKSKFEKKISNSDSNAIFYYLDLIRYRDISNEIAKTFNITHQSPQVIVIKDGVAVANASHYDIVFDISIE